MKFANDGKDEQIQTEMYRLQNETVAQEPTSGNLVRNVVPIAKRDSMLLMFSSCFFLIPGGYAIFEALYFYAAVSFVTTIVSVNYWRHAVEGFRRTADLWTAKLSFAIYFISGCFFIRNLNLLVIGIPGCCLIILFYNLSIRYWNLDSPLWVYFHMIFHVFVALEQFLVLYGGVKVNARAYFNSE